MVEIDKEKSQMKTLYLISAGLLFLAIINLPYGYYTFLRIVVTFTAVYGIIKEYNGELDFGIIALGLIAVLFNPIIPIHLGEQNIWRVLNLICGIIFLVKGLKLKS